MPPIVGEGPSNLLPVLAVDVPKTWLTTYGGRKVDLLEPRPDDIDLLDIAHALSMICRYGGHCPRFYSVAEHSVLVSHIVPRRLALFGLLHDAHEAYLGDVITPLKNLLPPYRDIAQKWDQAISKKFKVDLTNLPVEVHQADAMALHFEMRTLFRGPHTMPPLADEQKRAMDQLIGKREILGLQPEFAQQRFIQRCYELVRHT